LCLVRIDGIDFEPAALQVLRNAVARAHRVIRQTDDGDAFGRV
jgi:hypothetical protein